MDEVYNYNAKYHFWIISARESWWLYKLMRHSQIRLYALMITCFARIHVQLFRKLLLAQNFTSFNDICNNSISAVSISISISFSLLDSLPYFLCINCMPTIYEVHNSIWQIFFLFAQIEFAKANIFVMTSCSGDIFTQDV